MVLWRISNHSDLTGMGGERSRGRWHTPLRGRRIVYLSEHPAVALLENLANLNAKPTDIPAHFQLLKIVSTHPVRAKELSPAQLGSVNDSDFTSTQAIGDAWLGAAKSALLHVPSIPSPESWNYLLNPHHPDAASLKLEWARHVSYDRRLFRLAGI